MPITPRTAEELLKDVPRLQDLPGADLAEIARSAEIRQIQARKPLFSEGEPAEGLFVVRTGEIKVTKGDQDERQQIIYLVRPGRPIVEGVRFDGGTYPAHAVAMRTTSVLLLSNERLAAFGQQNPSLFPVLIDLRAHRSERTLKLVSDLSLRTVPARLASFIATLVARREARGEDARNVARDLTTETVAGRLGTVREEISRGLAYLEREGALKVSPDLIEVVDLERLDEIALGSKKPKASA